MSIGSANTQQLASALDALDDRVVWNASPMLAQVDELQRRAQEVGDELLMLRTEFTRVNLLMRAGDVASAAQQVPELARRATDLNAQNLLARIHLLWATIYRHLGDAANCLDHAVLSVQLLDETATDHMQIWHRAKLGDALSLNGSMNEARACFEEAVRLASERDLPLLALAVLNNHAYAESADGQHEVAREVVDRLQDHAFRNGFELEAPVLDTIGTIDIQGGNHARAERTLLEGLRRHAANPQDDADALPEYLLTLAEAQRGMGSFERAQESLEVSRRLCAERFLGQVLVKVHQEQARLHAARGDFAQAFAAHQEFFEAYVRMRSVQDEARARTRHAMLETAQARQDATDFREQARRDPLTGLWNRRQVDEILPGLIRSGHDLTVAFADLDYFKRINDLFGHDAGDQVLIRFAQIVEAQISLVAEAFAARMGGEEFLVVLPGTAPDQAIEVLESVRRAVEDNDWATIAAGLRVTVSLGAAQRAKTEKDVGQRSLLFVADQNLYAAKGAGRNRVVRRPADVSLGPSTRPG